MGRAGAALRCGLREDEIAGLRGQDVNLVGGYLTVTGKGGKVRTVPLPEDTGTQLNPSAQYLFTPSAAWRSAFRQAVARAARLQISRLLGHNRLDVTYHYIPEAFTGEEGTES